MKTLVREFAGKLQKLSPVAICAIALAYVAIIAFLDHATPPTISFTLFYVLAIAFVGWAANRSAAFTFALLSTIVIAIEEWSSLPETHGHWAFFWNTGSRLLVFGAVGWLTAHSTRLTRHLENIAEQRSEQWRIEAERHKSTAAKLSEALERFEQVTNNISEVFWLTDVHRKTLIYVSPGYDRVWGRSHLDLYQNPHAWLNAVHSADREKLETGILKDAGVWEFDFEFRIIRPDGETRWIRDRAFPVRDKNGEVYRVAGIAEDITERKLAEQQLADAVELNQKMLAASPMGIVAYTAEGKCVFANESLADIVGGNVEQIVQGSFRSLESWRNSGLLKMAEEALEQKHPRPGEFYHTSRFGKSGWLDAHAAPFVSGGESHVLVMVYDITERKRLETQLLEISDREQARLGQDIHDSLCQKLVTLGFDANSLQRKLAAQNRPEAAAAARIADLLDQSITETRQLSRGLFPIRLQSEGLASALEELAQSTSERFGVLCDFKASPAEVNLPYSVATHLYRIAQEAVNNAIRHGNPRQVQLRLAAENGRIELTIRDNGAGFKPGDRDHSAGMGLHIMDYRARAIRGSLQVDSDAAGTSVSCCVGTAEG